MNDSPAVLVHAKGLRKDYGSGEGLVRALDMVDLDVNRGEAADRLISMRDGSCVDETQLTGGSRGSLSTFAEWEHLG